MALERDGTLQPSETEMVRYDMWQFVIGEKFTAPDKIEVKTERVQIRFK